MSTHIGIIESSGHGQVACVNQRTDREENTFLIFTYYSQEPEPLTVRNTKRTGLVSIIFTRKTKVARAGVCCNLSNLNYIICLHRQSFEHGGCIRPRPLSDCNAPANSA